MLIGKDVANSQTKLNGKNIIMSYLHYRLISSVNSLPISMYIYI